MTSISSIKGDLTAYLFYWDKKGPFNYITKICIPKERYQMVFSLQLLKLQCSNGFVLLITDCRSREAAKALEVAALKSPLAQASLIESRKLIAEATRSIESIESGQLQSDDSGDEDPVTSAAPLKSNNNREVPDRRIENGSHLVLSDEKKYADFHGNRFTLPTFERNNVREGSNVKDLQVGSQPKINGFIKHKNLQPVTKEMSKSKEGERNTAAKAKKWVCGKLVEVDD